MNFIGDIEPLFWQSKEKEFKDKILKLKREVEVLNLKLNNKKEVLDVNQYFLRSDNSISDKNTQLLQSLFLKNPIAIILSHQDGNIKLCNSSAYKMFGYTSEEFLKLNIDDLVPVSRVHHAKLRQSYNQKPTSRGMGLGRDLHAKKKDDNKFPVEIGLNSIEFKDDKYIISAIVDLTQRNKLKYLLDENNKKLVKKLEQYQKCLQNTNTFFATIKDDKYNILHTALGEPPALFKQNNSNAIDLSLLIASETLQKRIETIKEQTKSGGHYSCKLDTIYKDKITFIETGFYIDSDSNDVFYVSITTNH